MPAEKTACAAPVYRLWRCPRFDALEGLIRQPGHRVPGHEVALMHPPGVEVFGWLGGHRLVFAPALVDELLDPRAKRDEHVTGRLEGFDGCRIALVRDDPGLVVRQREHLALRDDHPGERATRGHVEERIAPVAPDRAAGVDDVGPLEMHQRVVIGVRAGWVE